MLLKGGKIKETMNNKYRVVIPPPKSKRMEKNKNLVIVLDFGWEGGMKKNYDLKQEDYFFEFEVAKEFEYCYNTTCTDGCNFDVYVEYQNDTGSRKETYSLVPELIK